MDIRWIKPGDGFGGQEIIAAPDQARNKMIECYYDLRGSDDPIAIYVTSQSKKSQHKSRILGFVFVKDVGPNFEPSQYAPPYNWKRNWNQGIPVKQPWRKIPDSMLEELNRSAILTVGENIWKRMQYAFRSGAPRYLDDPDFQPLKTFLSKWAAQNWHLLSDQPNLGHVGAPPNTKDRGFAP